MLYLCHLEYTIMLCGKFRLSCKFDMNRIPIDKCSKILILHSCLIWLNNVDLKCVLHTGNDDAKIILFTRETLEKCWETKRLREETKKRKSKFDKIVLPTELDGVSGYHPQCYKYFQSGVKKASQSTGMELIKFIKDTWLILKQCEIMNRLNWNTFSHINCFNFINWKFKQFGWTRCA